MLGATHLPLFEHPRRPKHTGRLHVGLSLISEIQPSSQPALQMPLSSQPVTQLKQLSLQSRPNFLSAHKADRGAMSADKVSKHDVRYMMKRERCVRSRVTSSG